MIETIEKNNQNQSLYCSEYDNLLSDDIKMDSDNAFTFNSDIRNDSIFFETILSKKIYKYLFLFNFFSFWKKN